MSTLRMQGSWRVFFNRHGAVDKPWCVSNESGAWELAVPSVSIQVPSETIYQPKATPDDEDGRPSAWIRAEGLLVVGPSGICRIEEP